MSRTTRLARVCAFFTATYRHILQRETPIDIEGPLYRGRVPPHFAGTAPIPLTGGHMAKRQRGARVLPGHTLPATCGLCKRAPARRIRNRIANWMQPGNCRPCDRWEHGKRVRRVNLARERGIGDMDAAREIAYSDDPFGLARASVV